MRKVIAFFLIFGVLLGLCGCRKKAADRGSSKSESSSRAVSEVGKYEEYQTYTVDDNNQIIDSVTGQAVENDKLSVDESGNIILTKTRQIVVTAKQVQKNKAGMSTGQSTPQSGSNSSSSGAGSSSSATNKGKTSNTSAYNYLGTKWYCFTEIPYNEDIGATYILQIFEVQPNSIVHIYQFYYSLLSDGFPNSWGVDTFNGVKYNRNEEDVFAGLFVQRGDDMLVELCCYSPSGKTWFDDTIVLKRENGTTLKLISETNDCFYISPGANFTQGLAGENVIGPPSPSRQEFNASVFRDAESYIEKYKR